METPPRVHPLALLSVASRNAVEADGGLQRLFELLDRSPRAAPKESTAATISGRTVWEFRRAIAKLTGRSWHDFVRILHLLEKETRGGNALKKAGSIARDAGFSSARTMKAAEVWAKKRGVNLGETLVGRSSDGKKKRNSAKRRRKRQ